MSAAPYRIVPSVAIAIVVLAGGYQGAPISRTLRVLTYNIHHGEGTDGIFDLSRQADIVKSVDADLVALQEVDQHTSALAASISSKSSRG